MPDDVERPDEASGPTAALVVVRDDRRVRPIADPRKELPKTRLVRQLTGRRSDAGDEFAGRDVNGAFDMRCRVSVCRCDVDQQNVALRAELSGELGGFEDVVQRGLSGLRESARMIQRTH